MRSRESGARHLRGTRPCLGEPERGRVGIPNS